MRGFGLGLLVAMGLVGARAASAEDIATFMTLGGQPNVAWTQVPHADGGKFHSIGSTGEANATIRFSATPLPFVPEEAPLTALAAFGDIPALMTVDFGAAYPTTYGHIKQPFMEVGGTVEFRYAGADPLVVNGVSYATGALLLSMRPVFFDPLGDLMAGEFLSDFSPVIDGVHSRSAGFLAERFSSPLVIHDDAYYPWIEDFTAEITGGSFSYSGSIPEPASWTLMLAGFGLAGAALRRRKPLSD